MSSSCHAEIISPVICTKRLIIVIEIDVGQKQLVPSTKIKMYQD